MTQKYRTVSLPVSQNQFHCQFHSPCHRISFTGRNCQCHRQRQNLLTTVSHIELIVYRLLSPISRLYCFMLTVYSLSTLSPIHALLSTVSCIQFIVCQHCFRSTVYFFMLPVYSLSTLSPILGLPSTVSCIQFIVYQHCLRSTVSRLLFHVSSL